jgi:hypothetical protein
MTSQSRRAVAPSPQPERSPERPRILRPGEDRPLHRARWVIVLLFLLAVSGAARWYLRLADRSAQRAAAAIRTTTVRVAGVEKTLRLSGSTVAGRFSMLLVPRMAGSRSAYGREYFQQILQSAAKPGSFVHKGDIVAEFDRMYMLMRLDDYKASVVQHQANLRSLYAMLDVRRKGYEQTTIRYRGARDKAALEVKKTPALSAIKARNNQLDLEQYAAQLKEIVAEEKYFEISEKAAIRRSELDLRVSQLEFERAQRNAGAMIVRAPIDGMVVMQTIRRGSDVNEIEAGDQLFPGQPYMQIVDTRGITVEASVNQVDIEQIRVGAPARITFDAYPGLELPARVRSVGSVANSKGWRSSYVRDVVVRLDLEQTDRRVIPNFSVGAEIVLDAVHDVPTVQRESLFTDPEDGKTVAFVKGPSGWEKRDVEVGLTSNVAAEVKSGLHTGEVVATEWPVPTEEPAPSGN